MGAKVNFRDSDVHATDAVGTIYDIGEALPRSRGSLSGFGWTTSIRDNDGTRDRDGFADAIVAGFAQQPNNGSQVTWKCPVTPGQTYDIRLGSCDAEYGLDRTYIQVKDGATVIATLDDSTARAAGAVLDITGALHANAAAWLSSNNSVSHTFVGSELSVVLGTGSASTGTTKLSHLEFEEAGGGGGVVKVNPAQLGINAMRIM